MAKPLRCDQCGRDLTEEDFEAGRAVRDRADVFCAECASMYEDDERKRRMRARMAEAAAAIPKGRRGATTAMRSRTPGRRFGARGSQTARGRAPRSSPTTFYVVAAVVAAVSLIVIIAVLMSRRRRDRPRERPRRPAPAVGTGSTRAQEAGPAPKKSPDRRPDERTTTGAATGKTPATTRDDAPEKHGRSLFGPGGEFGSQPK